MNYFWRTAPLLLTLILVSSILAGAAHPLVSNSTQKMILVYVEEAIVQFREAPRINNGRVMVPLREISESLGAELKWANDSKGASGVTLVRAGKSITLTLGSKKIVTFSGQTITADVPPYVAKGVTFVPLRMIAELYDADVTWNSTASIVRIKGLEDDGVSITIKEPEIEVLQYKAYPEDTLKPEHERWPKDKNAMPVMPSAGYWGGTTWLDTHKKLVEKVKNYPDKKNLDILLVGDSLMQQWGGTGLDNLGFNKAWTSNFGEFRTINIGIGGDKSQNVLFRLEYNGVVGLQPKVSVLMIGANNLYQIHNGVSIEAMANGVKALVDVLRNKFPQGHVIVANLFPANDPPNAYRANNDKLAAQFANLQFDDPKVHKLDFRGRYLNTDKTLKKTLFKPDLIHLSDEGYSVFAEEIKPLIYEILKGKKP